MKCKRQRIVLKEKPFLTKEKCKENMTGITQKNCHLVFSVIYRKF